MRGSGKAWRGEATALSLQDEGMSLCGADKVRERSRFCDCRGQGKLHSLSWGVRFGLVLNFCSSIRSQAACVLILVLFLTSLTPESKFEIKHSESMWRVRALNQKLDVLLCKMDTVVPSSWCSYKAPIKTVGATVV